MKSDLKSTARITPPHTIALLLISLLSVYLASPLLFTANLNARLVFAFDSDEAHHIQLLQQALNGTGFDFNFHGYGHLFFNLTLLALKALSYFTHIDQQIIIITLRSASLVSGIACIWATFYLALYLAGPTFAILSALLLAIIPLEFIYYMGVSHPDVLQVLFVQLSLIACCRYSRINSLSNIIQAACFAGLAFATKYSGIFLLVLICALLCLKLTPRQQSKITLNLLITLRVILFLTGTLLLCISYYITPELVVQLTKAKDQLQATELAVFNKIHLLAYIFGVLCNTLACIPQLWRFLLNSKYFSALLYQVLIVISTFWASVILASPYSFKNFRILKGMLAESLHVNFGHSFKAQTPLSEWFSILASNQLLGSSCFIIFTLGFTVTIFDLIKTKDFLKSPISILHCWVILYLGYMLLNVRYREARYLFVILPSIFILASYYCLQISKCKFKLSGALVILLCGILLYHGNLALRQRQDFKQREKNYPAILIAKQLDSEFPENFKVAYDTAVYVPDKFKNAYFEWRWTTQRFLEIQPDIFILNKHQRAQYLDSEQRNNFYWGPELFTSIADFYWQLQNAKLEMYKHTSLGQFEVYVKQSPSQ